MECEGKHIEAALLEYIGCMLVTFDCFRENCEIVVLGSLRFGLENR
jgi:hypothetical protein